MPLNHMRVASPSPLNGERVCSLKISQPVGTRVLAQRWRAFEFGLFERVKTSSRPDNPGVRVVELYREDDCTADRPPGLEEVEGVGGHPMTFLLSQISSLAVVSSQMGYRVSGPVAIPTPRNPYGSELHRMRFDVHDYSLELDEATVLETHLERIMQVGIDSNEELAQESADAIFRLMISGTEERR